MMRRIYPLALVLTVALAACSQPSPPSPPPTTPVDEPDTDPGGAERPQIIFDTDLGYDADDAGALAVLHALADNGETDLLATMSVVGDPYSAGALSVINSYYGRPDVPVGAYMGERWMDARPYWLEPDTDFLEPLVSEYPSPIETRDEAREAVSLYRETLAAQPDGSVTVVTVGFLQNLADLLVSEADAHSPLSGPELVAQKVEQLVVMGGRHPEDGDNREFNFREGPENSGLAAQKVVQGWPTPIVFSGAEIGNAILTGSGLTATLPENPVARAYELYPGTNDQGERQSWDLTAVLYAVRGAGELWTLGEDEHLEVFDDGSHRWRPGAAEPGRSYLEEKADPEVVKEILDALLVQPPAAQ